MSDLSIPDLVIAIQADFNARGVVAKVLYGDWNVAKHKDANHVIVGLGEFDFTDPLGPGPYFQDPVAKTSQARSLMSRVQSCPIWVHATPPVPSTDPLRAEKSQVATSALLHATLAALWRNATGSISSLEKGEWPRPEQQPFVYGSLAKFVAKLSIPVLDDAQQFVVPNATTSPGITYTIINGVSYQVAKTP